MTSGEVSAFTFQKKIVTSNAPNTEKSIGRLANVTDKGHHRMTKVGKMNHGKPVWK